MAVSRPNADWIIKYLVEDHVYIKVCIALGELDASVYEIKAEILDFLHVLREFSPRTNSKLRTGSSLGRKSVNFKLNGDAIRCYARV